MVFYHLLVLTTILSVSFSLKYDAGHVVTRSGNCKFWYLNVTTYLEDGSFFQKGQLVANCMFNFTAGPNYNRIWMRFETYGRVEKDCSRGYLIIGNTRRCFHELNHKREYFQVPLSVVYRFNSGETALQVFFKFIKEDSTYCDESIVNPKGTIKSPGFPSTYPYEQTCRFTFTSEMNYIAVYLSIKTIDFGGRLNSNCSNARLTINGKDYCNKDSVPKDPILLESPAVVTYKQSKTPKGDGFEIDYVYVPYE